MTMFMHWRSRQKPYRLAHTPTPDNELTDDEQKIKAGVEPWPDFRDSCITEVMRNLAGHGHEGQP